MENFPSSLLDGYYNFKSGNFIEEQKRYETLAAQGQKPSTMVIGCCDSRAAPETIFNASPGELFVVRNVANLVPPYGPDDGFHSTSAALEFAVQSLKVRHILIMGHGRCGGVGAALNSNMQPLSPSDFIGKWISLLRPAAESISQDKRLSDSERQFALEKLSIRNSIENLRTFPYVSQLEKSGDLSLHGAWFDISHGELWTMNDETGDFSRAPINPDEAS